MTERVTYRFATRQAAWAFSRAAAAAGVAAGYPSLGEPWTVHTQPGTPDQRAELDIEALEHEGCWHGRTIDYRMGRKPHETNLVDGTAEFTIVSHDIMTLSERYCGHCHTWVTIEGVFGALKFMGRHDSGDCVAAERGATP